MSKTDENKLRIRERKILRRILGGIKVLNVFRRITNEEIENIFKKPNIAHIVKSQRARWLGHKARMSDKGWVKRVLTRGDGGKRRIGRPRKKWLVEVLKDLRKVGIKDWKNEALDRKTWKERVELESSQESILNILYLLPR